MPRTWLSTSYGLHLLTPAMATSGCTPTDLGPVCRRRRVRPLLRRPLALPSGLTTPDLVSLSESALRTEIPALDKYHKDTESFDGAVRRTLTQVLQNRMDELTSYRATGKRLDAAEAKLRLSQAVPAS